MQSTIDKKLSELKALTEKTATMQLQPARAVGEASAYGSSTSREEALPKGRTNTVRIPPGSIKFPVSMLSV